MKICGFLQVYNELEKQNLLRCLTNMWQYCDYIMVYDDASTDNSANFCEELNCDVLRGEVNSFTKETKHKQDLLEFAKEKHSDIDWFVWLDADEVFDRTGTLGIRKFLETAIADGYTCKELTLWRSDRYIRKDYLGGGKFIRFWKNKDALTFIVEEGLHKQLYPSGMNKIEDCIFDVIHYGYSTQSQIEGRWIKRNSLGVSKTFCNRHKQFDETNAVYERLPDDKFPKACEPKDTEPPVPVAWTIDLDF